MLQKSIFSENANLQNLLLVTAIRAAPDRVKDFIHRLDMFDGAEIAAIALQPENQLCVLTVVVIVVIGGGGMGGGGGGGGGVVGWCCCCWWWW